MSISVKSKYIVLGCFLAITAIFVLGWCLGHNRAKSASQVTIDAQSKLISHYVVKIDNNEAYISQIEQEVKTLRQAKKDGDITNEELRKLRLKDVNELTKAKVTIELLRDSVRHNGRIIIVHDTINKSENAILLPFDFMDKDKYVDLSGGFDINGNLSYKLTIPAEFSVYTGISKDTKKPVVTLSTDNPFVKITGLSSVKFDMPKPKKFGVGIFLGYGLNLSGNVKASPLIGVGLSYNILKF